MKYHHKTNAVLVIYTRAERNSKYYRIGAGVVVYCVYVKRMCFTNRKLQRRMYYEMSILPRRNAAGLYP